MINEGIESFKVKMQHVVKDDWISIKDKPASRDFPILIVCKYHRFPIVVKWGQSPYKRPAFLDPTEEYSIPEENILYWMPLPELPKDES